MAYTHNRINGPSGGIAQLAVDPTDFNAPGSPVFWKNTTEGVLKCWNGTEVKVLDFNEGPECDVFGDPIGGDI